MAITEAHSGDKRSPRLGRPKKMKNSWTMKGVLRTNSTYTATARARPVGPQARAQPHITPTVTPATADTAVSTTVAATPRSSSGQSTRTAAKSRLTTVAPRRAWAA